MYKRKAIIHSLKMEREVEIVQYKDLNHVIARYNEKNYTAVDNPFTGLIYVDDLFGEVANDFRF